MKRRKLLELGAMMGSGGWLGGCAFGVYAGQGETASYALFNPSHENSYEMTTLRAVGAPGLLYEVRLMPALPPGAPGWGGGGPLFSADTGHRVPERVQVSWRLPPREGQKRYQGDLIGPHEIELRSRIPAEVLRAVRNDGARRRLEIAVSVGVLPVQVRWQLVEPDPRKGLRTMRRGGDW